MFFLILFMPSFGCMIVRGESMMQEKFACMYDALFDDIYRYVRFKVGDKWIADQS